MSILDQFKTDINEALKAGDGLKAETLRGTLAAIYNREIELRGKGKELTEEEMFDILMREAKKRREANQIYAKAGRADLADKEMKELEIIKSYLPPELGSAEVESIVKKVVDSGVTDFGRVMQAVMQEVHGRAEAGTVKEIVLRTLGDGKK